MTTPKKWALCAMAIAGMLTAVSLNSCDNEKQAAPKTPSKNEEGTKISLLLDKMYAESDESGFEDFIKEYKGLNPQEFATFQTLRVERMAAEATQEVTPSNSRISNEQKAEIDAKVEETRDFFAAMDKQAVEKYGEHLNKLSIEQQGEIADISAREFYGSEAKSNSRVEKVQACPLFTISSSATETNSATKGYHYRGRADNDVRASICDFTFHFDGNFRRVRGERNIDKLLIRSFSSIARRTVAVGGYPTYTTETRLLFGGTRYIALFGAAGLNNAHLRMSNQ